MGVIGPNGAGKTTLLEVILGRLKPHSGEVLIEGLPPKKAMKQGFRIGYLTQTANIEKQIPLSVFETVIMGRYGALGLFRKPGEEDRKIVMESLDAVGIMDRSKRLIGELSGGEFQRVLIARALATRPKVLLLDEPDAGVDIETADKFMSLLAEIRDDYNIGIILVSHDIGLITRHADSVTCINRKAHFHDCPAKLTLDTIRKTFGDEFQLIVHELPKRALESHDA